MSNTMLRVARLAAIGLVAVQASACATVFRGDKEKFTVISEPPGASVKTTLGVTCTTPCTFKAKRKDRFSVTIAKDGYEEQTVVVTRKLGPGGSAVSFGGNAILGGAIGVGVDFSTGAVWDLSPNPVSVTLKPAAAAAETAQPVTQPAPEEAAEPAAAPDAPAAE